MTLKRIQCGASFIVRSMLLPASAIAHELGVTPTNMVHKGEPVSKRTEHTSIRNHSACIFNSTLGEEIELASHLAQVMGTFEDRLAPLHRLRSRSAEFEFRLFFGSESNSASACLPAGLLTRVAALEADVMLDLFPPGDSHLDEELSTSTCSVVLRASSMVMTPGDLVRRIGLFPAWASQRDAPQDGVRPFVRSLGDHLVVYAAPDHDCQSCDAALAFILDAVGNDRRVGQELDRSVRMDIHIEACSPYGQASTWVGAPVLKRLGELRLDLYIDLYPPDSSQMRSATG